MTPTQITAFTTFLTTAIQNATTTTKVTRANMKKAFVDLMTQMNDSKAEILNGLISPSQLPVQPTTDEFQNLGTTNDPILALDRPYLWATADFIAAVQAIIDGGSPTNPGSDHVYPGGHTFADLFEQNNVAALVDSGLIDNLDETYATTVDNAGGATTRYRMPDQSEIGMFIKGEVGEGFTLSQVDRFQRLNDRGISWTNGVLYLQIPGDGIEDLAFTTQPTPGNTVILRRINAGSKFDVYQLTPSGSYSLLPTPGGNTLTGNANSFMQVNLAPGEKAYYPSTKGVTIDTTVVEGGE